MQGRSCRTTYRLIHGEDRSEARMSSVLLAVDWIMKKTKKNRRNGIQWTICSQLGELDFADDLALRQLLTDAGKNRAAKHNTASTRYQ